MAIPIFTVKKPGLLTTIQDGGRYGFQSYGIPPSGAMDTLSYRIANVLVGNPLQAAVLEITLAGPHLYVENDVIIAICGADLSPQINGSPAPMWTSLLLRRGDELTFGKPISGARAYVSIAGEFALPYVFGSQATELKTKTGGYFGRPLQKGDTLFAHGLHIHPRFTGRTLKRNDIPNFSKEIAARIIIGPHSDFFTKESLNTLLSETYTLSQQSDRMGLRLIGPKLAFQKREELRSEATMFGCLQVPPSGQPILLMADRQTTGGYPIIGTVISVDLPKIAQAVPGSAIRFQKTTVEEAQTELKKREKWLQLLEKLHGGFR